MVEFRVYILPFAYKNDDYGRLRLRMMKSMQLRCVKYISCALGMFYGNCLFTFCCLIKPCFGPAYFQNLQYDDAFQRSPHKKSMVSIRGTVNCLLCKNLECSYCPHKMAERGTTVHPPLPSLLHLTLTIPHSSRKMEGSG